jgi:ABC-2 type transport system permease protein
MSRNKLKAVFIAFAKEAFRNKLEVFFTLFFPMIFLLLFGFFFGGSSDYQKTSVGLYQTGTYDISPVIEDTGAWSLSLFDDETSLEEKIKSGDILLGVTFDGEKISYLYREGDVGQLSTIEMARASISAAVEKKINNVKSLIVVENIPETAGRVRATDADYTMSGVVAISLLSAGMFSVISLFGRYRKRGVLDRFKITPLKPMTFILGSTLTRFLVSLVSILLIMIVSRLLFRTTFQTDWLLFLISIISSTLGMMALGLFLTLIFRNPETAETAASILMVIMVFLAGIYFPLSFLPDYLRIVSAFLPVKYVAELMRHSLGIELVSTAYFVTTNVVLSFSGVLLLYFTGKRYLRAS